MMVGVALDDRARGRILRIASSARMAVLVSSARIAANRVKESCVVSEKTTGKR